MNEQKFWRQPKFIVHLLLLLFAFKTHFVRRRKVLRVRFCTLTHQMSPHTFTISAARTGLFLDLHLNKQNVFFSGLEKME